MDCIRWLHAGALKLSSLYDFNGATKVAVCLRRQLRNSKQEIMSKNSRRDSITEGALEPLTLDLYLQGETS